MLQQILYIGRYSDIPPSPSRPPDHHPRPWEYASRCRNHAVALASSTTRAGWDGIGEKAKAEGIFHSRKLPQSQLVTRGRIVVRQQLPTGLSDHANAGPGATFAVLVLVLVLEPAWLRILRVPSCVRSATRWSPRIGHTVGSIALSIWPLAIVRMSRIMARCPHTEHQHAASDPAGLIQRMGLVVKIKFSFKRLPFLTRKEHSSM